MVDTKQSEGVASRIRSLFSGRSTISSQSPTVLLSPKSPAPRLGLSILSSPTIDIPGIPSHHFLSSRTTSPQFVQGIASPIGANLPTPPSAISRNFHSVTDPSSPGLQRSSPRRNQEWEHIRNDSGSRVRRRQRPNTRPHGVRKSILHEKAGRMKLLRCVGLGSLLAIGLTVCAFNFPPGEAHANLSRSCPLIVQYHQRPECTHLHDSCWSCSGHGIRPRHSPTLYVHITTSAV